MLRKVLAFDSSELQDVTVTPCNIDATGAGFGMPPDIPEIWDVIDLQDDREPALACLTQEIEQASTADDKNSTFPLRSQKSCLSVRKPALARDVAVKGGYAAQDV